MVKFSEKKHQQIKALTDAFKKGFNKGFKKAKRPLVADYSFPKNDITAEMKKGAVYIGGYAKRLNVPLAEMRSVCHDVGVEAELYINGEQSAGLSDYKQGVLTEGGIIDMPMPKGYKPLSIQLINKEPGEGGVSDPLNVETTVGWKALCVKEETKA